MTIPRQSPPKPSQGQLVTIKRWPTDRWPEGLGISAKDGWNFGVGFVVAVIVIPFVVLAVSCMAGLTFLTMMGRSIGLLF